MPRIRLAKKTFKVVASALTVSTITPLSFTEMKFTMVSITVIMKTICSYVSKTTESFSTTVTMTTSVASVINSIMVC